MNHKVFSVFDEKAGAYLPPFFMHTAAMAVRAISDCTREESHAFFRNPADYTLFHLGDFDDATGIISPLKANKPMATILEIRAMRDTGVQER